MTAKKTRKSNYQITFREFFAKFKTKLPNASSLINFLSVLISAGALWYSKESAQAAINAVEEQRKQASNTIKMDSIRDYQDSIRHSETFRQDKIKFLQDSLEFLKSIELSQWQIDALRQQADAMKEHIEQENAYQRPLVEVEDLGYWLEDNTGKMPLKYSVANRGIRPAELKKVKYFFFDSNFQQISQDSIQAQMTLVDSKRFYGNLLTFRNNEMSRFSTYEQIKKDPTYYIGFTIEYIDLIDKKEVIKKTNPKFYRWENNLSEGLKSNTESGFELYRFMLCTKWQRENLELFFKPNS